MPKSSFPADSQHFRGYLRGNPWCLCIGAGTSKGLIPDWYEVSRRILERAFGIALPAADFSALQGSTGWSLDSWIQTALNYYLQTGRSEAEFNELLETVLYEDLLNDAALHGLADPLAKIFNDPLSVRRREIDALCQYFEVQHADCSAVVLAKTLLEASHRGRLPSAIVTFNADTILHTIFTLFHLREYHRLNPHLLLHAFTPRQIFARVSRPLPMGNGKIPIYHLHGSLLPPTRRRRDTRDRLIFPESSYQQLAGSVFTWTQNTFLHLVQSNRMVFVGLSMSDPNIRRWLAWWTTGRKEEVEAFVGVQHSPMEHVWITTRLHTAHHIPLLENSLWHLGTRICWLERWSDLEGGLGNLLAL
jgi:hypothetical protein